MCLNSVLLLLLIVHNFTEGVHVFKRMLHTSLHYLLLTLMLLKLTSSFRFAPRSAAFQLIYRGARKIPTRWERPGGSNTASSIFESLGLWGVSVGKEIDPGNVKGTKLKILKYPHPKLRADNEAITVFDDELRRISSEMLLIMRTADGIGLAAPQVGINKRLMVFNEFADSGKSDMILVNPSIIAKSEDTDSREEGCLSFPQINGDVIRSTWIEVEYMTVSGEKVQKKFEGLAARIFQHEYDHLDKVLFIDRFGEKDKAMNLKRLEKYVKKYGPGGMP